MRKLLFIALTPLFLISCSIEEDLKIDDYQIESEEIKKITNLIENTLSSSSKSKVEILENKLIKIDDTYYLVSKSEKYRTTTLLKKEISTKNLAFAGVSCTSSVCSGSSTDCIPKEDGKSCTKCGFSASNCTKTVTSEFTRAD